jgi:hypothetical protein
MAHDETPDALEEDLEVPAEDGDEVKGGGLPTKPGSTGTSTGTQPGSGGTGTGTDISSGT